MDNDIFESAIKTMSELGEVIETAFRGVFGYVDNLFKILSNIKYKEKVKFKPNLKIIPTKTYWRDKRSSIYYCRNNC